MAKLNDWLTIDKTSGTGNDYVTLTASSYKELQQRATTLMVNTQGKEVLLTVQQKAFVNNFLIYKELYSTDWEGETFSATVASNIGWALETTSWITTSLSSSNAGRTTIEFTVSPNSGDSIRTGRLLFVSTNGQELGQITVAQTSSNENNNVIFYTTTNGSAINPYTTDGGLVTKDFVDGVGAYYYSATLLKVPNSLFYNRDTLKTVSVPRTVTEIGSNAFYDCDNLVSYDIPDTLTSIGEYAFYSCNKLTSFIAPSSLQTIGNYAFANSYVNELVLNEGLISIGENAFSTTEIRTLTIPNSVTVFGNGCFQKNNYLTEVNFGSGITSIPRLMFYGCDLLESITIPSTVTSIGYQAFTYCTGLKEIVFEGRNGASLTADEGSFTNCTELADAYVVDLRDWFSVTPYTYTSQGVVNLYVGGQLLTEFVAPINITTIPKGAFYNNPNITSIVVSDNVVTVEENAFINNSNASYLYLGKNYVPSFKYNTYTFSNIDGTIEMNSGYNLTSTSYNVFNKCYFTKGIFKGSNCTYVKMCSTFEELEFHGSNIVVGDFTNCSSLTKVAFYGTDITISGGFSGCYLLSDINLNEVIGVDSNGAFSNTSITKAIMPKLRGTLPINTFKGCGNLKELEISAELTSIVSDSYNPVFGGCDNLKYIKITDIENIETKKYAYLSNAVYDTGINATVDSRLEFDYKYTQSPSGDGYYEVIGAGNTDNDNVFQIRIQNNQFLFHIGSSQLSVKNIQPNRFYHFVVSLNEGVIIDGVKIGTLTRSNYTINAPFYINGIQYSTDRHANGAYGNITIDGVTITPKEDGFYKGDNKLNVVKSGVYEYEEVGMPAPTVGTYSFYGVGEYGFLDHPYDIDFSTWISTNQYYLGYYNWNKFTLSTKELDFDVADSYDVVISNYISNVEWEITKLPFWLSASIMNGADGDYTVTFTKIADYVETEDIVITIMGVDYKIKANYTPKEFDFLNTEEYNLVLDGISSKDITVSGNPTWLDVVVDGDNVTLRKNSNCYIYMDGYVYLTFYNGRYVFKWIQDGDLQRLPKSANRIYYTTTDNIAVPIYANTKYYFDKPYIGSGYINGAFYFEFDGDLHNIGDDVFRGKDTLKRISLPSELVSVGATAIYGCENLIEVDCGGKEKHLTTNAISMNHYHSTYTDMNGFRMLNVSKSLVYVHECGLNALKGSISFGADLQFLGGSAFGNCRELNRIDFYGMTPPTFGLAWDWQSQADYGPFHGVNSSCEIHAPIGSDYSSAYSYGLPSTCEIIYDLEAEEPTTYDEITVFGDMLYLSPLFSSEVVYYSPVGNTSITVGDSSKYSLNNKSIGNGWYVLSMSGLNTDADDYYDTVTINAGELRQTFNTVVYGGMGEVRTSVDGQYVTLYMKNCSVRSYSAIYRIDEEPVEWVTLTKTEQGDGYEKYYVRWYGGTRDIIVRINCGSDRFGRGLSTSVTIDV